MMWLLLVQTALATAWIPQDRIDNEPRSQLVISQKAGQRVLLHFDPLPKALSAWSEGLRLDLAEGPGGTVLLPAPTRERAVELRLADFSQIDGWVETHDGDAEAWGRYERRLSRWFRTGGAFPQAPATIAALEVEWSARREAFSSMGTRAHHFQYAAALLELEKVRARSAADHGTLLLPPTELADGKSHSLEVRGPGLLELATRTPTTEAGYVRYAIVVAKDDTPIHHAALGASENPEVPGWTHLRRTHVLLPHGIHTLSVEVQGGSASLQPSLLRLRPSLHSVLRHARLDRSHPRDLLRAMESAHLGLDNVACVAAAEALLDTSAAPLARARLVEHHPDPDQALAHLSEATADPLTALALARRWQRWRDVDPALLVELGGELPIDPSLLAEVADQIPAGFYRSRGLAIRTLAELPTGTDVHARWSALWPVPVADRATESLKAPGLRGGTSRAWIHAGQSVGITAPEPGNGEYPILRLRSEAPVQFTLDGIPFRGQGLFAEAVSAGNHRVEVQEGILEALEGDLVDGGTPFRERPAMRTPAAWYLPDVGAPGEVELLIEGSATGLVIATSDGHTWEAESHEGLSRVRVPVGPWADHLEVVAEQEVLVGAAFRRALERGSAASVVPGIDPLEQLRLDSANLRKARNPGERVSLRLSRAQQLATLGLHASARAEASAAGGMPGATFEQIQQASHLYWNAQPLVLSAPMPGPISLAAAAGRAGIAAPATTSGLERLAAHLPDRIDAPVHLALAEMYLKDLRPGTAWLHASLAGDLGRVARLQIAASAPWQHITRVDEDGGSDSVDVPRRGPKPGDSVLRLARDAMLAAPWVPEEHVVLRAGGIVRVEIHGGGTLELSAVSSDETHAISPPACSLGLELDGTLTELEVLFGPSVHHKWALSEGEHVLRMMRAAPGCALGVQLVHNETALPPTRRAAVHRLGAKGLSLRVAGESLLRIRVHGNQPVQAMVGDRTWTIESVGMVPLPAHGLQQVRLRGPLNTRVSLSRLQAEESTWPRGEVSGLRPTPPKPSPDPLAAQHAQRWLAESAFPASPMPLPMGRTGTISGAYLLGNDATGVRDDLTNHGFQAARVTLRKRLGSSQDWLFFEVQNRTSLQSVPGTLAEARWTRSWDPWLLRTALDGGFSGGAGHVRAAAELRREVPLAPNWSAKPFATAHLGRWSESSLVAVDPAAWNAYERLHPGGLGLGAHADWRPLRDGRLRFTLEGRSTALVRPNWIEGSLRLDCLLAPGTRLTFSPGMGYRFVEPARVEAYWRPRATGQIMQSVWLGSRTRISLGAGGQYLPTIGAVDIYAQAEVQRGPHRGLRDHSPLDLPFRTALDIPEGKR